MVVWTLSEARRCAWFIPALRCRQVPRSTVHGPTQSHFTSSLMLIIVVKYNKERLSAHPSLHLCGLTAQPSFYFSPFHQNACSRMIPPGSPIAVPRCKSSIAQSESRPRHSGQANFCCVRGACAQGATRVLAIWKCKKVSSKLRTPFHASGLSSTDSSVRPHPSINRYHGYTVIFAESQPTDWLARRSCGSRRNLAGCY